MVQAAKKSGVRRFIHMSALGTRPEAASRYHQTKWAAEEIVRQSGLAHTIFRPSVINGPFWPPAWVVPGGDWEILVRKT